MQPLAREFADRKVNQRVTQAKDDKAAKDAADKAARDKAAKLKKARKHQRKMIKMGTQLWEDSTPEQTLPQNFGDLNDVSPDLDPALAQALASIEPSSVEYADV